MMLYIMWFGAEFLVHLPVTGEGSQWLSHHYQLLQRKWKSFSELGGMKLNLFRVALCCDSNEQCNASMTVQYEELRTTIWPGILKLYFLFAIFSHGMAVVIAVLVSLAPSSGQNLSLSQDFCLWPNGNNDNNNNK